MSKDRSWCVTGNDLGLGPDTVVPKAVGGEQLKPSPMTASHGTASLAGGYMIITPYNELPGYDPDAELVLVSKAGKLQWVPVGTCS